MEKYTTFLLLFNNRVWLMKSWSSLVAWLPPTVHFLTQLMYVACRSKKNALSEPFFLKKVFNICAVT